MKSINYKLKMHRVYSSLFYQLCEFSFKLLVFFSLIVELLLEYCDLVMFSYNVFLIASYYIRVSALDVIYLVCVWCLKFTPFAVLFFYVITDSYGIKKEKRYYLAPLMAFQSLVLLKTEVTLYLSNSFEDTIIKKEDSWFLFVTPYSLLSYHFLGLNHHILVGYLTQLGFNVYVFVVLSCHYIILRPKSKNHIHDDETKIAVVGAHRVRPATI